MVQRPRTICAALALAAALLAPPLAHGATLRVSVDDDDVGTPAAPSPAAVDLELQSADPSSDAPGPAMPLGTVSFDLGPQFRLGGAAGDATCAPEQVLSDETACPEAARVASGTAELRTTLAPSEDPYYNGPVSEELDLTGYEAPGGGAINLLASGDYPQQIRAIVPATFAGSTVNVAFPPAIVQPGPAPPAELEDLELDLGSFGRNSPVATTGCTGSWPFNAIAQGAGPPVTATTSLSCADYAPPDLAEPSIPFDEVSAPSSRPSRRRHSRHSRVPQGLCGKPQAGVHCGPGYGRRTSGGKGKVSHQGWPAVTGVLWIADDAGRSGAGTKLNDEMLGGNGSDRLVGRGGHDILWGDQHPFPNGPQQKDVMLGGAGSDWIYTSHGTNTVDAGPGADHVYAFYGHGTVDCGAGNDTVWIHRIKANQHYTIRRCERRKYF